MAWRSTTSRLKYYDSGKWIPVNENNFPADGVDVVLPYPNGTDSKDTFQIVHMLTKTGSEGKLEKIIAHTKRPMACGSM